jgi:hypothetical protein
MQYPVHSICGSVAVPTDWQSTMPGPQMAEHWFGVIPLSDAGAAPNAAASCDAALKVTL